MNRLVIPYLCQEIGDYASYNDHHPTPAAPGLHHRSKMNREQINAVRSSAGLRQLARDAETNGDRSLAESLRWHATAVLSGWCVGDTLEQTLDNIGSVRERLAQLNLNGVATTTMPAHYVANQLIRAWQDETAPDEPEWPDALPADVQAAIVRMRAEHRGKESAEERYLQTFNSADYDAMKRAQFSLDDAVAQVQELLYQAGLPPMTMAIQSQLLGF